MATIEELTETIVKFRDERDWAQFHNAKDLSLALSIEAAELNQLFLWKSPEEANVEKIKEETIDGKKVCLYENKNYLPLGVTYSSYMTRTDYDKLNPIERELALSCR